MAEPTSKNKSIRDFQSALMGVDVVESIRANRCVSCQGPAIEFRDENSRKDFPITGLCQACQDGVYGSLEE